MPNDRFAGQISNRREPPSHVFYCKQPKFLPKMHPPEKFSGTGQWVGGFGLMFRHSQASRTANSSRLRSAGSSVAPHCTLSRETEPYAFARPLEAEAAIPFSDAEWRLHATSSAEIMRRLGERPVQLRNTRAEAKGVLL
jgi:hypothetical protein